MSMHKRSFRILLIFLLHHNYYNNNVFVTVVIIIIITIDYSCVYLFLTYLPALSIYGNIWSPVRRD
jgi:hypothetical protein